MTQPQDPSNNSQNNLYKNWQNTPNNGGQSQNSWPQPPQYQYNENASQQQYTDPQQQWGQRQPIYAAAYQPQYEEQYYPEQPQQQGKSPLVIVLATLACVAVVALVVFAAITFFGKDSDDSAGSAESNSVASAPDNNADDDAMADSEADDAEDEGTDADSDSDEAPAARPEDPNLPAFVEPVNDAAAKGTPAGNLNNVWKSGKTSDDFAAAVRDAYVDAYTSGDRDEFDYVVEAYSSATNTTYTMNCKDNGQYVHCTGGDNANVYIA